MLGGRPGNPLARCADDRSAIVQFLGNHLQGSKVNGKLVSFDTKLDNGDVVEIVRRDSAHPSSKWLEIVRTSLARRHIRIALGMTEPSKPSFRKKKRSFRSKS
jgi:GTP pyrophosphokinase